MITEEEKKIIKRLKDDIALVTFNDNLNYGIGNLYVNINDLKIILNLISKLQAEELLENSVSKDKIREKIEEVKSLENVSIADMLESEKEFCIDILEELL